MFEPDLWARLRLGNDGLTHMRTQTLGEGAGRAPGTLTLERWSEEKEEGRSDHAINVSSPWGDLTQPRSSPEPLEGGEGRKADQKIERGAEWLQLLEALLKGLWLSLKDAGVREGISAFEMGRI